MFDFGLEQSNVSSIAPCLLAFWMTDGEGKMSDIRRLTILAVSSTVVTDVKLLFPLRNACRSERHDQSTLSAASADQAGLSFSRTSIKSTYVPVGAIKHTQVLVLR